MNPLSIILFLLGYTLVLVFHNFFVAQKEDEVLQRILPEKTGGRIGLAIYAFIYLVLPLIVFLFTFHLKYFPHNGPNRFTSSASILLRCDQIASFRASWAGQADSSS